LPDKFYDIAIKSIIAMKKRAVNQNTAQNRYPYMNGNSNRNLENILFDDFIYVCCKIQVFHLNKKLIFFSFCFCFFF
jgi:hypothetical protein